jgi:RNA polymerase sigma-70 factor (ECF subfamily)
MTESIIKLAISGDQDACAQLYYGTYDMVYGLMVKRFGSDNAEDYTQDAYLKIFKKLRSFRGQSKFSTWASRIAINEGLQRIRKKHREMVSMEEKIRIGEEEFPLERALGCRDSRLDMACELVSIAKAMRGLTDIQSKFFIEHHIEGMECHEVARDAGVTLGTAKRYTFNARQKLKKALAV